MANKSDKIAQRIASITASKPVIVVAPSPKPASGRQDNRRAVYRHGRLTVAGGVILECIIVNVSENGARVDLDGASALPDMVVLKIVMTGETRRARVVWKRENSAGLSFLIERKSGFGNAAAPASQSLSRSP